MGSNPLSYLVSIIFELYLMVVILRLWLQLVRADFYNPLSQFVVKVTNPVITPFRRIIPGWGGFDVASLVLAYLVCFAKMTLLALIEGFNFQPLAISILSLKSLVEQTCILTIWVMLIRAVLSFVMQHSNPMEALLHQLTEPLLAPIRRFVPPVGGLDLSMLVFCIVLQMFLQTARYYGLL